MGSSRFDIEMQSLFLHHIVEAVICSGLSHSTPPVVRDSEHGRMGPAWSALPGALLSGTKKATSYVSLWRGLTERRNYASRTAHRRTCRSCRQTTASLLVFFIRAPPYAKMLLLYHVFEKAQPAFLEGVRVTFPHLSLVGYAARGRLNLEFGPVIECSSGTSFFQPSLRDGVGYLRGCTGVETPAYFQA